MKEETLPLPIIEEVMAKINKDLENTPKDKHRVFNGKPLIANILTNGRGAVGNYLEKDDKPVLILGCKRCGWIETPKCPHYGDVNTRKHHSNGYCMQRLDLAKSLIEEGVAMTTNRLIMVKHFMELEELDTAIQRKIANGEAREYEILPFKKLLLETIKDLIKHEEGSKLTVKKEIGPLDIAELLRKNRQTKNLDNVEVKDVKANE